MAEIWSIGILSLKIFYRIMRSIWNFVILAGAPRICPTKTGSLSVGLWSTWVPRFWEGSLRILMSIFGRREFCCMKCFINGRRILVGRPVRWWSRLIRPMSALRRTSRMRQGIWYWGFWGRIRLRDRLLEKLCTIRFWKNMSIRWCSMRTSAGILAGRGVKMLGKVFPRSRFKFLI